MAVELKVPEVGESITEVEIGRWLKNEGDSFEKDEPLVEIETDKVTVELPAPTTGTISQRLKQQGDAAQVGEVIGYVEEGQGGGGKSGGSAASAAVKETAEKKESKPEPAKPQASTETETQGDARIMPAAQRLLDEHNLRADDIEHTGPGGRLLKEDVQRHIDNKQGQKEPAPAAPQRESAGPSEPQAPTPPTGAEPAEREEEVVPMSPMRRRIAERLVQAQSNAAMLTTFNEVDMSAIMDLRNRYKDDFEKKYGIKLGFMSFFVKGVIDALKQFPAVNAEIRDESIVYKNYYDIGIAVSTDRGLLVPVLRSAERLSFADIELAIADFAKRARDNKIQLDELQGGTFTITNGGVFGSLLSTPILNPPQSGVLGMHTIQKRPVAVGDEVKIRPMMYTALTYDHRIIDGREAVSFLKRLKDACEDPSRMLMEI